MSQATALITLQEIDLKLLRLASALAKMPQQARLKTIALARKKTASELTGIVGQRKDAELEIKEVEESLAFYNEVIVKTQTEAQTAQTHRELAEIERSLTGLAKRKEKCEFGLPALREKLAKLERAEKNAQAMISKLDEEERVTGASLDEETADLKEQIRTLSRERDAVRAEVGEERLADYEAARKRFGGLAVERLRGNVPSVCRVKLQPSQFHDLAHGDEITRCPYCHRILVTSEATEL